jgi:hypothetical protein
MSIRKKGPRSIIGGHYLKPLCFYVESPGEVEYVKIVAKPDGVVPTHEIIRRNTIELSQFPLNAGYDILLYVILKNDPDPWSDPKVKLTGMIQDIPQIEFRSYTDALNVGEYVFDNFELSICGSFAILYLLIKLFIVSRRRPDLWTSRFREVKVTFLATMTGVTVIFIEKVIWHMGEGLSWWYFCRIFIGSALLSLTVYYCVIFKYLKKH